MSDKLGSLLLIGITLVCGLSEYFKTLLLRHSIMCFWKRKKSLVSLYIIADPERSVERFHVPCFNSNLTTFPPGISRCFSPIYRKNSIPGLNSTDHFFVLDTVLKNRRCLIRWYADSKKTLINWSWFSQICWLTGTAMFSSRTHYIHTSWASQGAAENAVDCGHAPLNTTWYVIPVGCDFFTRCWSCTNPLIEGKPYFFVREIWLIQIFDRIKSDRKGRSQLRKTNETRAGHNEGKKISKI